MLVFGKKKKTEKKEELKKTTTTTKHNKVLVGALYVTLIGVANATYLTHEDVTCEGRVLSLFRSLVCHASSATSFSQHP